MRRAAAGMVIALGGSLFAAFVVSEILTDRVASLQRLWWIPRPPFALACVLLLALGAALAPHAGRLRRVLALLAVASVGLFAQALSRDFGLPRPRPSAAGVVRIVHWNAAYLSPSAAGRAVEALLAIDPDAVVVSNPGQLLHSGRGLVVQERGYEVTSAGFFLVLSRIPCTEARPIVASARGARASRFALASRFGAITLEAIDLPSDPDMGRFAAIEDFSSELSRQRGAPPDIFVGDFNITRGSASLETLAPDARDAFRDAGAGLGYTFPRERPWLAIDLALVRPPWVAMRAEIVDPGVGRHRMQAVDLIRLPGEREAR